MEGETDPNRGGLYYCNNHFKIILTKFIEIDMTEIPVDQIMEIYELLVSNSLGDLLSR